MQDQTQTIPSVGTAIVLTHTSIANGWICKAIDAQSGTICAFWSAKRNDSLDSGDTVGYLSEWKMQNDRNADPRKPKEVLRQVFELLPLPAVDAYRKAQNA